MRGLVERVRTDRGLFLLIVALLVAVTALVVLLGWYDDVMRVFWDLV
jgi:hypothetical protein